MYESHAFQTSSQIRKQERHIFRSLLATTKHKCVSLPCTLVSSTAARGNSTEGKQYIDPCAGLHENPGIESRPLATRFALRFKDAKMFFFSSSCCKYDSLIFRCVVTLSLLLCGAKLGQEETARPVVTTTEISSSDLTEPLLNDETERAPSSTDDDEQQPKYRRINPLLAKGVVLVLLFVTSTLYHKDNDWPLRVSFFVIQRLSCWA